MALSDLINELDPKYASALSEVTASLRREFDQKLSATRSELGLEAMPAEAAEEPQEEPPVAAEPTPVAEAGVDSIAELKHAVVAIDGAESQGEVLAELVKGCSRFASRCAVFLVRDGGVNGWTSHGFSLAEDEMRSVSFAVEASSPWERLAAGNGVIALDGGDCGPLCASLGADGAEMGFLLPFVLNNQTAAGVYCDRVAGDEAPDLGALQLVTFIASQVLENLPVRDRAGTSTLRLARPAAGAPVEQAPLEAPPTPAAETPASDQPSGADDLMAAAKVGEETPDALFAPEPEDDLELMADEQAPPPAAEEPEESPSWEAMPEPLPPMTSESAAPESAMAEPETAMAEPETAMTEPLPPTALEPATAEPAAPARVRAPEPTDEPSSEPEPDTPAAEPMPQAGDATATVQDEPAATAILSEASTEVAPPADLEGPGWAFSGPGATAPESGDDSQHEEARRLARLLVTEVKLYNEELVEKGRKNGDVYSVLRDDIDRSRQIFNDRIAEEVRAQNDYFREALVRILAGGDPAVLGV